LAWSNVGNIAHIVDGGRMISLQSVVRDADAMKWTMSKPSETPIVAPEGVWFKHIQFNGFGVDLATTDQHGVVRIYSSAGTLSKMVLAPGNLAGGVGASNDLDAVVGLRFLPTYPAEARVSTMIE
jgi:mediator of RNA polymerase II transcription subunit 16, fungi type